MDFSTAQAVSQFKATHVPAAALASGSYSLGHERKVVNIDDADQAHTFDGVIDEGVHDLTLDDMTSATIDGYDGKNADCEDVDFSLMFGFSIRVHEDSVGSLIVKNPAAPGDWPESPIDVESSITVKPGTDLVLINPDGWDVDAGDALELEASGGDCTVGICFIGGSTEYYGS